MAIAVPRPHIPNRSAAGAVRRLRAFVPAWLEPLSIQVALLALALVWMLVGTAMSICTYTVRVGWAYRSTLASLSRHVGVIAGSSASARLTPTRRRLPRVTTVRRRAFQSETSLLLVVGAFAAVALGWVVGHL